MKYAAPILKIGTYLRNYTVSHHLRRNTYLWAIEIFYCKFDHLNGEREREVYYLTMLSVVKVIWRR